VAEERRDEGRDSTGIKVTDKRMFTADGELREDYRHLGQEGAEAEASGAGPEPAPPPAVDQDQAPPDGGESAGHVEMPHTPGSLGSPGFMELVSVLAEPIAVYLGDAKMPDGSSAENPEAARFYIDLLEVLQKKTAGNLSAQEGAILEDLLYQLRMRYVRKRG
jgi:hypothetical protein